MATPQPKSSTSKPSGNRANTARAKSGSKTTGARSGSATSQSGGSASRAPKKRASQARSSSNASSRAKRSTRSAARSNGSSTQNRAATNGRASGSGITDTIRDVASKAKGPAVAVGAAAAGVAGGMVIRSRTRRKTILGIPVPKHLPTVDPQAIVKSVGNASKQFAKTSKSVSKDIERAGDQAERIGKILG